MAMNEFEIEQMEEKDEKFEDYEDWELEDDDEENDLKEITLSVPQSKFIMAKEKYPLFLAGFGSGKSLCMAINILNDLNYPNARVAGYAPTYDLLSLITAPYLEELLSVHEIPYKYNKNENIIHLYSDDDGRQIILRSLSNPERIVGYQVFRSHIDELDTVKKDQAKKAWQKVIARNRQKVYEYNDAGKRIPIGRKENGKLKFKTVLNRVCAYTTPEGFQFCYEMWEKEKKEDYAIYRASTYSNIDNLPPDYIETLRRSYPAELVDAYIEGIFVNLVGGRVYPKFDRELNHTDLEATEKDELHVGMDFNVITGAAIIHIIKDGLPYAVDEIHNAYDTDEQIAILKERYPRNVVYIYPDQTGKNRHASNTTETDIQKLHNAGYYVYEDFANPPIKERVYSMNAMFCNGLGERRYKVNTKKCPEYTLCLEQQIWSPNGLPDKSSGLDHKPDAAGYFIHHKYPIVKPTASVSVIRRY